jgi:hypothetical protein
VTFPRIGSIRTGYCISRNLPKQLLSATAIWILQRQCRRPRWFWREECSGHASAFLKKRENPKRFYNSPTTSTKFLTKDDSIDLPIQRPAPCARFLIYKCLTFSLNCTMLIWYVPSVSFHFAVLTNVAARKLIAVHVEIVLPCETERFSEKGAYNSGTM